MEITKREILFGTIILSIMLGIGIWLSNPIISNVTERASRVVSAVQVKDSAKFDYIRRTNVGDFLAEGTLFVKDPVSIPDISGQYGEIRKNTEEYRMHTRVVTTTDGKGHTHSHTETYYSWDVVKRESWDGKRVEFLGQEFTPKGIHFRYPTSYQEKHDAPRELFGNKKRYVYYTAPTSYYGLMTGNADNKTLNDVRFRNGDNIHKVLDKAFSEIKGAPIGYWVFWVFITAGVLLLFFYFENRWLY